MITVNQKDWLAVGEKFFGTDKKKWKFKCPVCGNAQSIEDFEKLGMSAKEAADYVYFSCIGRWSKGKIGTMMKKGKPCDYTLGGLFKLGELEVIGEDGSKGQLFEFADDNAMRELEKVSFKDPLEEMEKICQVGTLWVCKKEFDVEPRSSDAKARTIKVGEIMEFRYPYPINFRTVEDLYYSCNERVFLMNSDYYGTILEDIRFGNRHTLKQILDEKLFKAEEIL
jgi:hypothetical protein